MTNPDRTIHTTEPFKSSYEFKFCESNDTLHFDKYPKIIGDFFHVQKPLGFSTRSIEVPGYGFVTLSGHNFNHPYGESVVIEPIAVLTRKGLMTHEFVRFSDWKWLKTNQQYFRLELLKRGASDDSLEHLPECTFTIDGDTAVFSEPMHPGVHELPEEDYDWIEEWNINVGNREQRAYIYTPADPKILNLLTFTFKPGK